MKKDITSSELTIGTRYWLDTVKNVSGVFEGTKNGLDLFSDQQGSQYYIVGDSGYIEFATGSWFHTIN